MILIKNGSVYLGGGRYEPGWDILTKGGVIEAVGPGLHADGAEVTDASRMEVYPGLVLALSAVGALNFADGIGGWDSNETSSPLTPALDVRHAFDLMELQKQRFLRAGITSYGLSPGTGNLLAGQMSFINTAGDKRQDVFLAERIAVKGNFTKSVKQTYGERKKAAPGTRMMMYQMLDEGFRAAREYMEKGDAPYDASKEVLVRALKREIPFVVNANTQSEIESIIQIGDKYALDVVICGAFAAQSCADAIIERGWHVVLGDPTFDNAGLDSETDLAQLVALYRKGLKLSISCSGDIGYPPGYEQLLWVAALMSRAGATGTEIMDMMTINPARALRVDSLVGSLEKGKRADIIICRGNPALRFDNFIEKTIVAGRERFCREGE